MSLIAKLNDLTGPASDCLALASTVIIAKHLLRVSQVIQIMALREACWLLLALAVRSCSRAAYVSVDLALP